MLRALKQHRSFYLLKIVTIRQIESLKNLHLLIIVDLGLNFVLVLCVLLHGHLEKLSDIILVEPVLFSTHIVKGVPEQQVPLASCHICELIADH